MLIQIKHRYSASVIFEHIQANNTIKITLEKAVKENADLHYANLENANLRDANLENADLQYANLENANLRDANLENTNLINANMEHANFSNANISNANMRNANLANANLSNADMGYTNLANAKLANAKLANANLADANLLCQGDMTYIHTMQLDKWKIGFTKDVLQIGCQRHSHQAWQNFTDEDIARMNIDALQWWKKWKTFIFKAIELTSFTN